MGPAGLAGHVRFPGIQWVAFETSQAPPAPRVKPIPLVPLMWELAKTKDKRRHSEKNTTLALREYFQGAFSF